MIWLKKHRFLVFLTVYGMFLCLAGAFAMRYLWLFLEEYEAVLPEKAAARYEQEYLQQNYEGLLDSYASRHATAFQGPDEIRLFLGETFAGQKPVMKKDKANSEEGRLKYSIWLGDLQIGRVVLDQEELPGTQFGMKQYVPSESSWKLPGEYSASYSVTAPVGAEIRVNGIRLSPENAICSKIPAPIPEVAKDFGGAELCHYEFQYYGTPFPEVTGREDCVYTLSREENAFAVTVAYAEGACQEQRELAEKFASAFIAYGAKKASMDSVLRNVVYGTTLFTRISSATSGLYWAVGGNYQLQNFEIVQFVPYGRQVICDAAYDISDPQGNMIKSGMRMLMVQERGTWKVYDIEML